MAEDTNETMADIAAEDTALPPIDNIHAPNVETDLPRPAQQSVTLEPYQSIHQADFDMPEATVCPLLYTPWSISHAEYTIARTRAPSSAHLTKSSTAAAYRNSESTCQWCCRIYASNAFQSCKSRSSRKKVFEREGHRRIVGGQEEISCGSVSSN